MAAAWEYLLASWALAIDAEARTWTAEYLVQTPGADEPAVRAAPISGAGHDLLNELGAQGWELVSESVTESIIGTSRGFSGTGSFPIAYRWVLKRAVADRSE